MHLCFFYANKSKKRYFDLKYFSDAGPTIPATVLCLKKFNGIYGRYRFNSTVFSINFLQLQGSTSLTYLILAAHPNLRTTHECNFCTCHRTLFSDYFDQSLTTRSPERGFSISITLALHLAQPHCASLSMDTMVINAMPV